MEQVQREFEEFYAAARDDCLRVVLISVGDYGNAAAAGTRASGSTPKSPPRSAGTRSNSPRSAPAPPSCPPLRTRNWDDNRATASTAISMVFISLLLSGFAYVVGRERQRPGPIQSGPGQFARIRWSDVINALLACFGNHRAEITPAKLQLPQLDQVPEPGADVVMHQKLSSRPRICIWAFGPELSNHTPSFAPPPRDDQGENV